MLPKPGGTMKAFSLILIAAAANAQTQAQCRSRQAGVDNYLRAAETFTKACEALKAKGLLGPVHRPATGVSCGYPGLAREPGAEKAEIKAYFNKAKAYVNDCRGLLRQKALVPASDDCGHPLVLSGWAECGGAGAAKPDASNGWAGAWGTPWGPGKVFTGKVDQIIQKAEQHSFGLLRPGTNEVMMVTMNPKTEAIVGGKQIPKSEGFSHVRTGQTVNVFYEGSWAVR